MFSDANKSKSDAHCSACNLVEMGAAIPRY